MSGSIKPRLDRRVARAIFEAHAANPNNGYNTGQRYLWREVSGLRKEVYRIAGLGAIRAIARELPPIQAARLLRSAGIEQKGKKG